MKVAPVPSNEEDRLKALYQYQLLDTMPEDTYDDITKIASEISGTSIATITLLDRDRQWFKAKKGLDISETSREVSFCAHALNNPSEPMIVPDARYDERFHDNPLTTSEPHIIFYAGVPIVNDEGYAVGTLCVMDNRPRELPAQKLEALKALSKLVKTHFELRKANIELEKHKQVIREAKPLVEELANHLQAAGLHPVPDSTAAASMQEKLHKLGELFSESA